MKKCVFVVSLTGLLCLLAPAAAQAGAPQYRLTHTAKHAALRHSPKPPKRDQVRGAGLDGSLALIQFIRTRRSQDERHQDQAAPQDSVAQVLASWDQAARESAATLAARGVDTLPPYWGATHLSI